MFHGCRSYSALRLYSGIWLKHAATSLLHHPFSIVQHHGRQYFEVQETYFFSGLESCFVCWYHINYFLICRFFKFSCNFCTTILQYKTEQTKTTTTNFWSTSVFILLEVVPYLLFLFFSEWKDNSFGTSFLFSPFSADMLSKDINSLSPHSLP